MPVSPRSRLADPAFFFFQRSQATQAATDSVAVWRREYSWLVKMHEKRALHDIRSRRWSRRKPASRKQTNG
jgi:hypothetical protein